MTSVPELVRYLLEQRNGLNRQHWTVQGFGFLRLRVSERLRVHVWHQRLRKAGVSDIHDHTQWAFDSLVLSGSLINVRYDVQENPVTGSQPYHEAVLKCGVGGGMVDGSVRLVHLQARAPEQYLPGMTYHQDPDEVHRTIPQDGTVTLICQARTATDTARVYWPAGGAWGDAEPRQAETWEIHDIVDYALKVWNG